MNTPLGRIALILFEAFRAAKDNLVRLRASDGNVIDFQGNDLLAFTDPDGHVMEIIHRSDAS